MGRWFSTAYGVGVAWGDTVQGYLSSCQGGSIVSSIAFLQNWGRISRQQKFLEKRTTPGRHRLSMAKMTVSNGSSNPEPFNRDPLNRKLFSISSEVSKLVSKIRLLDPDRRLRYMKCLSPLYFRALLGTDDIQNPRFAGIQFLESDGNHD